jgi:hypothetical protein
MSDPPGCASVVSRGVKDIVKNGGVTRDRTADLLRARQTLSQLSYNPIKWYPGEDLNLHACAPEPKSGVSTNFTTRALIWCSNTDSNRGPFAYKASALPAELLERINCYVNIIYLLFLNIITKGLLLLFFLFLYV